jgi:hypothetical protein
VQGRELRSLTYTVNKFVIRQRALSAGPVSASACGQLASFPARLRGRDWWLQFVEKAFAGQTDVYAVDLFRISANI